MYAIFEIEHLGEHSCEVILNLNQWFRRRCHLKKKFMHDRRTMDRLITIAHLEPLAQVGKKLTRKIC